MRTIGRTRTTVGAIACTAAIAIGIVTYDYLVIARRDREIAVVPARTPLESPSTVPSVIPTSPNESSPGRADGSATHVTTKHATASPTFQAQPARAQKKRSSTPTITEIPVDDRPVARQALSFVGTDPDAEAIWMQSINDPNTSAHDRQDLIEDLNEDGFPDPNHPTADDLPLIESRIALIESLAPSSMDDVNAAAFAEAYKDLLNMHARASSQ
jgi:hypothetical protein